MLVIFRKVFQGFSKLQLRFLRFYVAGTNLLFISTPMRSSKYEKLLCTPRSNMGIIVINLFFVISVNHIYCVQG